jgi:hypothetical protein
LQIDTHRLILTQTMTSSAMRSRELVRPEEIAVAFVSVLFFYLIPE